MLLSSGTISPRVLVRLSFHQHAAQALPKMTESFSVKGGKALALAQFSIGLLVSLFWVKLDSVHGSPVWLRRGAAARRKGVLAKFLLFAVKAIRQNVCGCVCMWLTFRLGGHCKRSRAFTQAVSVGRHHSECVLSVRDEVVDGDLQFSWSCGVLNTLPVESERERASTRGIQFCSHCWNKDAVLLCVES